MDDLATLDDLTLLWRTPANSDEEARAQGLLNRASALLRQSAPLVDQRIASGALDPVVVATVVAGIVARFLNNPQAAAAKTVTTGPYSESVTWVNRATGAQTIGRLVVTEQDIDQLFPRDPRRKLGSIKLTPALAPRRVGIGRYLVEEGLVGYPNGVDGFGPDTLGLVAGESCAPIQSDNG